MSVESLGLNTADTTMATATTGGSANTKGNWQSLGTTSQDCEWLIVSLLGLDFDETYLVDIGTGSGTPSTVVSNIQVWGNNSYNAENFIIPLTIASGTEIQFRAQATGASATIDGAVYIHDDDAFGTSASNITLGADTSNSIGTSVDPGGTAHTKGPSPWQELTASTSADIDWFVVKVSGYDNNNIGASANFFIDIGTGASGSETALVENLYYQSDTAELFFNRSIVVKETISSGTRVSVRCQSTETDATDRVISVSMIGCNMTAPAGGGGNQGISQGLHTIGSQVSA